MCVDGVVVCVDLAGFFIQQFSLSFLFDIFCKVERLRPEKPNRYTIFIANESIKCKRIINIRYGLIHSKTIQ